MPVKKVFDRNIPENYVQNCSQRWKIVIFYIGIPEHFVKILNYVNLGLS